MKKVLGFLVSAIALFSVVSCGEKKSFDVLDGEWNVVAVGEVAVPDSAGAFIGFNIAEQFVYGNTGCNHLTGALPAEINPEIPMFAALGSTRMMCADMTVENIMLPALGQVVDFAVDGDDLYLLDAAGNTVISLARR